MDKIAFYFEEIIKIASHSKKDYEDAGHEIGQAAGTLLATSNLYRGRHNIPGNIKTFGKAGAIGLEGAKLLSLSNFGGMLGKHIGRGIDRAKESRINKTASIQIDELYKFAKEYLEEIVCENCGFEGQPEVDGRCPKCGAMEGIKPRDSVVTVEENNHSGHAGVDSIPAHEMGMSDINDLV